MPDEPVTNPGQDTQPGTTPGPIPTFPDPVPSLARLPTVPGYKILAELGRGAAGAVYKARHERLGRVVALKILLPGTLGHANLAESSFQAEAEAIACLHHPNIVQIYEIGEVNGQSYLALEYVAGGTLRQRLSHGPLPARTAARLIEVLARAVHVAHRQGIIHRDLKPANILLGPQVEGAAEDEPLLAAGLAVPKIADFGVAIRPDHDMTRHGQVVGTPAYMAPEQAMGQGLLIGPPTDVYALGAILYECLTGRSPFSGSAATEQMRQAVKQPPVPPRRLNRQVPADLQAICLKCLAKDPAQRYRSALALADDLQRFLHDEEVEARPPGWWRRGWRWARRQPTAASWLLTVLGVLALAVPGVFFLAERLVNQSAMESADQQAQMALATWQLYSDALNHAGSTVPADGSARFHAGVHFLLDTRAEARGRLLAAPPRAGANAPAPENAPTPATFVILLGDKLEYSARAESGQPNRTASFKVYSDFPFRKRADSPPTDPFGKEALRHYQDNKPAPFARLEPRPEGTVLRYAVPVRMSENCRECHNNSMLYDLDLYRSRGSFPRFDWVDGEARGVLEIIRPMDPEYRSMRWTLGLAFAVALVGAGCLLMLSRLVLVRSRPQRTA
jgi:hypothetical protein